MSYRLFWLVVVGSICVAATSVASVQVKRRINRISTGPWVLTNESGAPGLTQKLEGKSNEKNRVWLVSAPTIQTADGKYLSGDPAGKEPSVSMVDKKSDFTEWEFELGTVLSPKEYDEPRQGTFRTGDSGFEFRIKLANGPYKDWYVSVADLTEEQSKNPREVELRPLILTKDVRNATRFTYVEISYSVR